ncbi:MAG: lytic murein transglycosylase [Rickettsiales bacterium]|jgi:membrane-bound lytic murein transglycosylase B|nr:lytic murein transglycosylase [Rickettsiales bacterium]
MQNKELIFFPVFVVDNKFAIIDNGGMRKLFLLLVAGCWSLVTVGARADTGTFDFDRWDMMLADIGARAAAAGVRPETVSAVVKNAAFIPGIVNKDRNQPEKTTSQSSYVTTRVNPTRIAAGREMAVNYRTLFSRAATRYGVPAHVLLAFWGMESDYGKTKSTHKLADAFITLIYEGRRETFFMNQLIALMQSADADNMPVGEFRGSWAGAMGHFQFIPTTLQQYGVDGDGDGRIDIINDLPDAVYSAANFLAKLGWNGTQKIVRPVALPSDFELALLDGKTRRPLADWAALGVIGVPNANMRAGLIADIIVETATECTEIPAECTTYETTRIGRAFLTYENFYRIKRWNNSTSYALAVALLADEIKNAN